MMTESVVPKQSGHMLILSPFSPTCLAHSLTRPGQSGTGSWNISVLWRLILWASWNNWQKEVQHSPCGSYFLGKFKTFVSCFLSWGVSEVQDLYSKQKFRTIIKTIAYFLDQGLKIELSGIWEWTIILAKTPKNLYKWIGKANTLQ